MLFCINKDQATSVASTADPDDSQTRPTNTDVQLTCSVDANPTPRLTLWIDGQEDNDGENQMRLSLSKAITLTKQHNGVNFQCKAMHSDPDNTINSDVLNYDVTCKFGFKGLSHNSFKK